MFVFFQKSLPSYPHGPARKNYLLNCRIVDISATNLKLKLIKSKWPKEKIDIECVILLRLSWLVKQNRKNRDLETKMNWVFLK